MSEERGKVKCKTELEFITEVADDCIANLKDKDREYLINNPCAIDYHFSYCLYIRNHYIHNRDFSEVDFLVNPDHLSSEIIRMVFAKLIPEYDYGNEFIEQLFDDKRFIQLRQEYKTIYGEYPVAMVEEHKDGIVFEPTMTVSEIRCSDNVDIDKEIEACKRNREKSRERIEKLLKKLAEKVWRLDNLRKTAEECGIDDETLLKKHKYPPEGMDDAVQTVMLQRELRTDNNDMDRQAASYSERPGQYTEISYDTGREDQGLLMAAEASALYGSKNESEDDKNE